MSSDLAKKAEQAKEKVRAAMERRRFAEPDQSEKKAAEVLAMFEKQGFPQIICTGNLDSKTVERLKELGVRVENRNSGNCKCGMLMSCEYCTYPYKYEYTATMEELLKKPKF